MAVESDEFAERVAEIARKPVQDVGRMCENLVIYFDELVASGRASIVAGVSVDEAFQALTTVAYARGGLIVAQTIRDAIVEGLK